MRCGQTSGAYGPARMGPGNDSYSGAIWCKELTAHEELIKAASLAQRKRPNALVHLRWSAREAADHFVFVRHSPAEKPDACSTGRCNVR